ncbi:MAG: M23 family metallopeptidase [Candidatus Krumholzibacteria bacterium]|jgi:murein DD-endopeptidase MepM/ murein hydrolase activator NlpD|nr:M23 family metallopeptidase [Candidatus Krumholzibacteria bacterium]
MNLKKRYSFLYLPAGDGPSRTLLIPAWIVLPIGGLLCLLLLGAGLYALDWKLGVAWRPGGSPIVLQNEQLARDMALFQTRMAMLQSDLDAVFGYQQMLAEVVDLEPLDNQVRAAGIGGRGPLSSSVEISEQSSQMSDLQLMLRQARIQRRGMSTILDSLTARQTVRDRIPSIRPSDIGWISSRFGIRRDPFTGQQAFHRGVDFSLPLGTPVRATADGIVATAEKQRGLGRLVKIDHGGGVVTVYGHLQEAKVAKGQRVTRGEVIALSGSSGRSTAPHLHYEVLVGGRAVNPLTYILDTYASLR